MSQIVVKGKSFDFRRDLIDVTSLHRPNENWCFMDASGHEHRWYVNGTPATKYSPSDEFTTPTLKWVFEGWGYWEDGERYAIGHHECLLCGEHVERGYKADEHTQHIVGMTHYSIDGRSVSEEEFKLEYVECGGKLG